TGNYHSTACVIECHSPGTTHHHWPKCATSFFNYFTTAYGYLVAIDCWVYSNPTIAIIKYLKEQSRIVQFFCFDGLICSVFFNNGTIFKRYFLILGEHKTF